MSDTIGVFVSQEGMTGAELIAAERQRQIEEEGWTPEHDADHSDKQLAHAAKAYIIEYERPWEGEGFAPPLAWPWHADWWKPRDPIRNLVKAGALIAAEIDRLHAMSATDRATGVVGGSDAPNQ